MDKNNFKGVGFSHKKCQLLSYQLFGPPTKSLKSYSGPCVDLYKKPSATPTSNGISNSLSSKAKNSTVNYCLVCYSNNMNNILDTINMEDLTKFLKIITTPVKNSYNTLTDNESQNINSQFELILQQLADTTFYLCITCSAACKNLLQVYQQMEKLEQEVKTFKAKFVNVIKLSKSITENRDVTSVIMPCNKTVDTIRTFLVGGELTSDIIKEERISDAGNDIEDSMEEESHSNDINIEYSFPEDISVDQSMTSDDDLMRSTEKVETTKFSGPKRINKLPRRHKGQPGTKRLAVEDLKQTKSNKEYVKWRKMYGSKMSLTAYKKMRREDLSKLQNVIENKGIPGRSNIGKAGLQVNWVEKDNGKLEYLGFEVIKNDDGTFSCSLCIHENVKPSKTRKSIGDHIKRRHVEVSNGHSCEKCTASFFFHYQLTQHVEEKHVGIQCKTCGLTLANRSNLTKHERIKHQGIKANICEHCGKGFATLKDMTIHVRRHTGERPFVCHVCAQTFIDKQSMKTHIRKKHPDESGIVVKTDKY